MTDMVFHGRAHRGVFAAQEWVAGAFAGDRDGQAGQADGARALVGSVNFSPASLDRRRELAIEIDDAAAILLARRLAKRIEEKRNYAGQVKVTVIRETRCVEYAR